MRLSNDVFAKLCESIDPVGWLGHETRERFASLCESGVALDAREIEEFFARRDLKLAEPVAGERSFGRDLIDLDLRASAHALSFLFSEEADARARGFLPRALAPVLAADAPQLDHVGLEVFGRLEWYIDALAAWAATRSFRLTGHRIFPSVQVRKALAGDPQLSGVRIARVYFESDERCVNLEIFETMQHWLFTAARGLWMYRPEKHELAAEVMTELGWSAEQRLVPIAHVALKVRSYETVATVHAALAGAHAGEPMALAYGDGLSYNPGDASTNTKLVTHDRLADGRRCLGPVVEIISYEPPLRRNDGSGGRHGRCDG